MSATDTKPSVLDGLFDAKGDPFVPSATDATLAPKSESKIAKTLATIGEGITGAFEFESTRAAAYKVIATAVMALRESVILPNGFPDWAGRSKIYWALLHSITNPLYATKEGIRFRQVIGRGIDNALSDIDSGMVRQSAIRAFCDKSLTAEQRKPNADGTVSQAVKDAMRAQYEAQGTKSDGTPWLKLPEAYGGPAKGDKVPKVEPGSPEAITAKLQDGLRAITATKDGEPTVSPEFLFRGYLRVATVVADWASEHVDYLGGKDALLNILSDIQVLDSITEAALNGRFEESEKTMLASARWTPDKDDKESVTAK